MNKVLTKYVTYFKKNAYAIFLSITIFLAIFGLINAITAFAVIILIVLFEGIRLLTNIETMIAWQNTQILDAVVKNIKNELK